MKEYFLNGKKVGAMRYFRSVENKGKSRKSTTKQIPCSVCKKPLWITQKNYDLNKTKRFVCDIICRRLLQSNGENIDLKGGYTHNTTGYKYVRVNGKPVLYHRILVERHIGKKLKDTEHVHHLNGIKNDNRIENLAVVSNSNHPNEKLKYIQKLQERIRVLEKNA